MPDENVIRAFPSKELPDCPVEEAQRPWRACSHERISLAEHDRTVICQDCGASLDPFRYLLEGARAIRRGWENYRHVAQLVAEKRGQIEVLEKERRRLASQVRRLKEKSAPGVLDVRKPL